MTTSIGSFRSIWICQRASNPYGKTDPLSLHFRFNAEVGKSGIKLRMCGVMGTKAWKRGGGREKSQIQVISQHHQPYRCLTATSALNWLAATQTCNSTSVIRTRLCGYLSMRVLRKAQVLMNHQIAFTFNTSAHRWASNWLWIWLFTMHNREDIPSFPTFLQYHSDKGNMVAVLEVYMRTLLGRKVEKHPQKNYIL